MEISITDEARRFKAFRLAENLTQKEFGEAIGRREAYINKIENGSQNIKIEDVKNIAEKFKMSYEWFYHGRGNRVITAKDENLLTVTSELKNKINLLEQKVSKQDQIIKKLVTDVYDKSR